MLEDDVHVRHAAWNAYERDRSVKAAEVLARRRKVAETPLGMPGGSKVCGNAAYEALVFGGYGHLPGQPRCSVAPPAGS